VGAVKGAGPDLCADRVEARKIATGKRQRSSKPILNNSQASPANDGGVPESPQVDPRLVFLLMASIYFDLVEAGEVEFDEAYDALVPYLDAIYEVQP
jgi:hypothetical protein